MRDLFRDTRLWLANRLWHFRLRAARQLLQPGTRTWEALDRLGVAGFGTSLIRVDFPPDLQAPDCWNSVRDVLLPLTDEGQDDQLELLNACLGVAGDLQAWPTVSDPARPRLPWVQNEFLTPFDMAVLYGLLRHLRPENYVEIGSGLSTRVADAARTAGGFSLPIISVDPEPRVEVAEICDQVCRCRLEEALDRTLAAVTPRSVLFFDGSHRCFPRSDVTVFFLALLPHLPAGAIVHLHDIYLPEDYPAEFLNRYWSEQYLLGAWMLGGMRGARILLPCARLAGTEAGRRLIAKQVPRRKSPHDRTPAEGSSFWLQKT